MTQRKPESRDGPEDEFIRRLRIRIENDPNLTMTNLAAKAGLGSTAIRSFFNGRAKSPRLATIMKILDALGETLEEFMGEPQTPEERDILRLVSRMPDRERLQLLGFAKALAAEPETAPKEASEETE